MNHSFMLIRLSTAVVLTGLMLLPAALLPAASAQAGDSKAKAIGIAAAVEALPAGVRPPGRYALVIGADAYNDSRIPGLPACGNDARTLAAVLTDPQTGMVPRENLRLLVGADVTKENVIDAMDHLGRKAGRDDLVIVFFSGHGATDERGRAYWIMSGTKADMLRATALPETDVSELLGEIHATRLVTFIDACYSAATANVAQTKSLLDLSKLYPDFKGDGRVAITASKGDQLSMVISRKEDPGFGYSAFAWHLIEGLKGKADTQGLTGDNNSADGVVTVDELWAYVKDRTERTSRGMGGNQQPQIKGQLGSRFLLTVNSSRMLEIEREREARTNKTAERLAALRKLFVDDRINPEQFAQGRSLLEALPAELDVTQQKQRKVYEDLTDGRITAGYLTAGLDAIETPQQREALERAKQPVVAPQPGAPQPGASQPVTTQPVALQPRTATPPPAAEGAGLSFEDRVQHAKLNEMMQELAAAGYEPAKSRQDMEVFLRESAAYAGRHPEDWKLWSARALSAIALNKHKEGWEAGQKLKASGAAEQNNEAVFGVLAKIDRKGWLVNDLVTIATEDQRAFKLKLIELVEMAEADNNKVALASLDDFLELAPNQRNSAGRREKIATNFGQKPGSLMGICPLLATVERDRLKIPLLVQEKGSNATPSLAYKIPVKEPSYDEIVRRWKSHEKYWKSSEYSNYQKTVAATMNSAWDAIHGKSRYLSLLCDLLSIINPSQLPESIRLQYRLDCMNLLVARDLSIFMSPRIVTVPDVHDSTQGTDIENKPFTMNSTYSIGNARVTKSELFLNFQQKHEAKWPNGYRKSGVYMRSVHVSIASLAQLLLMHHHNQSAVAIESLGDAASELRHKVGLERNDGRYGYIMPTYDPATVLVKDIPPIEPSTIVSSNPILIAANASMGGGVLVDFKTHCFIAFGGGMATYGDVIRLKDSGL